MGATHPSAYGARLTCPMLFCATVYTWIWNSYKCTNIFVIRIPRHKYVILTCASCVRIWCKSPSPVHQRGIPFEPLRAWQLHPACHTYLQSTVSIAVAGGSIVGGPRPNGPTAGGALLPWRSQRVAVEVEIPNDPKSFNRLRLRAPSRSLKRKQSLAGRLLKARWDHRAWPFYHPVFPVGKGQFSRKGKHHVTQNEWFSI